MTYFPLGFSETKVATTTPSPMTSVPTPEMLSSESKIRHRIEKFCEFMIKVVLKNRYPNLPCGPGIGVALQKIDYFVPSRRFIPIANGR